MRRNLFLVVCVAALGGVFATGSSAAAQPPGTVSWGAGQPTTAKGTISAFGTWTAQAGWVPINMAILHAVPTAGGQFLQATAAINANNTWGVPTPAKITQVPTGQYSVYVTMTFKNTTTGQQVTIGSPTAIVNVP